MSLGSGFQTTCPETRKLLGDWARNDGYSQVVSMSRTQVYESWRQPPGSIAGAAEECRTSTKEGVVDKNRNLEVDTLTDENFLLFKISLAAALRRDCSLLTTTLVAP